MASQDPSEGAEDPSSMFKSTSEGTGNLLKDLLNGDVEIKDDGDADGAEDEESKEMQAIAAGAMAATLAKEDIKTLEARLAAVKARWEKQRKNFDATARELQSQLSFARRDAEEKKLTKGAPAAITSQPGTAAAPAGDAKADTTELDSKLDKIGVADTELVERSKFIPLRLTLDERKFLRLITSALEVSEYTDRVDIARYRGRAKRIHRQLKEICAILSGLLVAVDYKAGQKLVANDEFSENEEFFQYMFELGRRYKILNPERMRSAYGKLIYLLQDSQQPTIKDMMGFTMVRPLQSVSRFLTEKKMMKMLDDPLLHSATRVIQEKGKTRREVQYELQLKRRAYNRVKDRYIGQGGLTEQDVELVMGSIGDNNYFLKFNRDPCDEMIGYLESIFDPDQPEQGFSLAIGHGRGGARLSHSHKTQYFYVMQTLTLWRDILNDFYRLWFLAEEDLLDSDNGYAFRDTGQGMNRLQRSPNIAREMGRIIYKARQKVGYWIGSSVVHLGDHNVPNAFMFIDKYTQVSRILNPLVITLRRLEEVLGDKPGLDKYVRETFGGVERLKRTILCDFFKHGFDGSGADNFFDAGSCIDGRLTSAWNWCSLIHKKDYYPVFQITGFASFDGQF